MFDFDDLEEAEVTGPPPADDGPKTVEVDEAKRKALETAGKASEKKDEINHCCTKYKALGYPLRPGTCKFRIFCFHNAGSSPDVFSNMPSPFASWLKENKSVELVAIAYPGRDNQRKDKFITTTDELTDKILPVLFCKLADGVPFVFWAHSVGTWVATDLLMKMRICGMDMPLCYIASDFPGPNMPPDMRPWRVNARLNYQEMRDEGFNWDPDWFGGRAKIVFEESSWKDQFEPLFRADFTLFDEHVWKWDDQPKWDFPVHTFHMEKSYYVKTEMVEFWQELTVQWSHDEVPGMGHLTCNYVPENKKVFHQMIVDKIKEYAPPL